MRCFLPMSLVAVFALACGSSGGGADAVADPTPEVSPEVVEEAAAEAIEEVAPETGPEGSPEAVAEVEGEAIEEVAPETVEVEEPFPPRKLPFEYTRPAEGETLTPAEITAFTKKVTGLWKKVGYARWILRTSTGVDASTAKADYLGWHNDVLAVKAGDTVTFKHKGGEHNMWIPGSMVLAEVSMGYLLTGDWELGKATEQYCKGLTAVVKGFVWDEDDPAPYLMARSIFPMDHSFALDANHWKDDGRKKAVEFHDMYHDEDGWNAQTFAWPHNPTWGSMYVTNMRSKDDVRAIVRTTTWLPYVVADAKDEFVRTACQETWDTMKAFNKDIVDSGYYIRTKDKDGVAYKIPCPGEEGENPQDLGSYVCYSVVAPLDPRNECCARLASDMIAYGVRKTNDCGTGTGSIYDMAASAAHCYNYPIVWDYHMAALGNSLVYRQHSDAKDLLDGLGQRMDSYMHPSADEPGPKECGDWNRDMAVLLVQAASMGLPLNANETRHVHKHWTKAVEEFDAFPRWDLWDAGVPDGEYWGGGGFRPQASNDGIPVEALAILLEYCNSPFRNPSGQPFIDCDVAKDVSKWGK
jgi:plastocyanin